MICKIRFKDSTTTYVDLNDLGPSTVDQTPAPYDTSDFEDAETFKALRGMAAANLESTRGTFPSGWSNGAILNITSFDERAVQSITIFEED